MQKKILIIVGTRPNYMKVAVLNKLFQEKADLFEHRILHTGQHYDANMKDIFLKQLQMENIHYSLGITQGNPAEQIGGIISRISKICFEWKPDIMLVVGDVNSTLAAAIAANKTNTKLGHIESGLRSNDRTMPEEINRIITDELSDLLFVTEQSGLENLSKSNREKSRVHFVGNTMIDTLIHFNDAIEESDILEKLHLKKQEYVLMTIHRPSNVDEETPLNKLLGLLKNISTKYKIVFPIHPRTVQNLKNYDLDIEFASLKNILLIEPLDYFSFQKLTKYCKLVITDSGGIQEETTFRKIPCLTLRENTERPSTVALGTNELIPFDTDLISQKIIEIETGIYKKGSIPPYWDGRASERILDILLL
ncbi:MAG: non-hydrolyzing UDP-N-acetylglucosamine 2-epimerase [Chitinophagales bacterium]